MNKKIISAFVGILMVFQVSANVFAAANISLAFSYTKVSTITYSGSISQTWTSGSTVASILSDLADGEMTGSLAYTINTSDPFTITLPGTETYTETISVPVKITGTEEEEVVALAEDNEISVVYPGNLTLQVTYSAAGYNYQQSLTFDDSFTVGEDANLYLNNNNSYRGYGNTILYIFNGNVDVSGNLTFTGNTSQLGNDGGTDGSVVFGNEASMTVKDGGTVILNSVAVTSTAEPASDTALITVESGGTLSFESSSTNSYGTIEASGTAIELEDGATATIGSGSITSESGSAIVVDSGAKLVLTDDTFSTRMGTTSSITTTDENTEEAISLASGSTVTIDGVSYTVSDTVADGASNYVDNDGLLHLTTGATVTVTEAADEDVNIYDYLALDDDAYAASSSTEGVDYVITTVGEALSSAVSGSSVIVTTAPNETSTTDESDESNPSPTPTTTQEPIITGGEVAAAYAAQAAAEVASIVATESNVETITTKRIDTVTDYGYNETTEKYTLDVEPLIHYTITYSDGSDPTTYTEELDLSGSEASVTFTVPSGATDWTSGTTVTAIHSFGGDAETLTADVVTDDDVSTLTYTTTNGFSTWVMYLAGTAEDDSSASISITYSEYEDEDGNTVAGKYNINVKANDSNIIYRFMAAQLAFTLETDDAIGYEIEPADGINLTTATWEDGDGNTQTVYEFNMDTTSGADKTIDDKDDYTYTIGTITFTGVGTGTFGVNGDYSDNMVQAAVYDVDDEDNVTDNSIVKTYTVDSTIATLNDAATIPVDLSLATTELTVNVMFPNAVTSQGMDYTQMAVEYSNVSNSGTVELGNDNTDVQDIATIADVPASGDTWTGYQFTITVPTDYATTLKFTGDGYRTYNTSIVPTGETATVTVWNNVMDSDETVVISSNDADTGVMTAVTFLAGDIVNQGTIDLYDLSAVVSYFGKTDIVDDNYIKYDLNRDGKIDSKDIAMVLVSWGK